MGDVAVELDARRVELAQARVGAAELGHLLLEVGHDTLALLHQPGRGARARRGHLLGALEVALDHGGERARVDGLLQEAVAAHGEAGLAIALGGDGHDGDAGERGLAAEAEGDFEAVEAGDVEVHQDQIRPLGAGEAHAFEAVGGVDHLVPGALEQLADEEAVGRIVFDVEDPGHRGPSISRRG